MTKGINAASIAELTPTVVLDTAYVQSFQEDGISKDDAPSPSSENWFESLLECMDVTEAEQDAVLTESEEEKLLYDQIDDRLCYAGH